MQVHRLRCFPLRLSLLASVCGLGAAMAQDPAAPQPLAAHLAAAAGEEHLLELTLEQALLIAVENDLGLELEAVASEVAGYDYAGSWGSFDPVLTATAALTNSDFEANSSLSGASVLKEDTQEAGGGLKFPLVTGGSFDLTYSRVNSNTNNSFELVNPSTTDTVGLALTQPLLRGAWRRYATSTQRVNEITYHQSLENFRRARQQLLLDVHWAYWDLVAAIEQLAVADTTLELGRRQQDQNQRRLDAGVGTEVEVLQAEANVARRIEERLLADVNVRAAQDKLKAALFPGTDAASWDSRISPTTPLPESLDPLVPPWTAALAVALENRAELRRQRLEIDAKDLLIERSRSERLVGLDLELSTRARGFDGDSLEAFESASSFEFPAHRAALQLSMPLGNRSARNAERAARASARAARLVYDQLESQIVAEVRGSVRQILYQSEAVKAAVKSLELARRQLVAEEARYREGLSTNFQVLEFQQQLAEALSTEKRVRVNYAKALATLAKAEGVLGEKESR